MTDEKILKVLKFYEVIFYLDYDDDELDDYILSLDPDKIEAISHILSMIPQMREFLKQGRREKVMRWLGFIQGVLWMLGEYSLEELKNHNRPDPASKEEGE